MQTSFIVLCVVLVIFSVQFLFFKGAYPNVSAVQTTGNLSVYQDQNCTQSVTSIDWGIVFVSQIKEIVVFVKNEGNQTFYLNVKALNWNPLNAFSCLVFSFSRTESLVHAGQVDKVILRLYASLAAQNIDSFSFDIVFEGLDHFPGDINRDGEVNSKDAIAFGKAFYSQPGDSNWNLNADINSDNIINCKDGILLSRDFGKNWT